MATLARRTVGALAAAATLGSVSAASLAAQAAEGTITGVVTDAASGQPVGQVRVLISGTTNGTLTADNGRYTIRSVPSGTITLDVNRIGYDPKKVTVTVSGTTPAVADYKVVITNSKTAGHLYDGKLSDVLYDTTGAVMYERSWDVGAMAAGEQITLTYSVEFPTTTPMGAYRNVASIAGSRLGSGSDGKPFAPVTGEATVTLGGAGLVLGAALDCSLAVAQTLTRGMVNPEVAKLQRFLNTQGAALPGTNFFGPLTHAAVSAFQTKYAADILAPIGLTGPTGTVAGMTIKKIKALACGEPAATATQ